MRSATAADAPSSFGPQRASHARRAGALIAAAATLALAACAGLATAPPQPDPDDIAAEQAALQRQAIAHQFDRRRRVASLAWPILTANAPLCGDQVRPAIGAVFSDPASAARLARGLRERDIRSAGHAEGVEVAILAASAPAARAGLAEGAQVLALNGTTAPADMTAKAFAKALRAALKQDATARLTVSAGADGRERTVEVTAEPACDFAVAVGRSSAINAYTDGKRIVILPGLERALEDDGALSLVIAHELAHAALRHPRKMQRNALLSGGALLGPVASLGGTLADAALRLAGAERPVGLGRSGAALVTFPYGDDFEREADYVGLYLYARAGGDLAGLEDLYAVFSAESPSTTWHSISHPTTSERRVALRQARAEIEAKRAAGAPLIPDGWERP